MGQVRNRTKIITQALQRGHRLRQLAQHDRSVRDTFLQTGDNATT